MATHRIGILTGGGDVPGLNSVIKSVVYNASEIGCEVIGIRRGWEGLTHMRPADVELDARVPPPARPDQHADDRPDRRHDAAYLAHQPGKMKESRLPPT
jgi:ATP-dependent phosphofructokinase / diphosphate-dependent phosphofructokinase